MVLWTESHAQTRGARIYAELVGGALTSDAHHITAPDSEGNGARGAMTKALRSAKLNEADINVVFAHGTSTPLNDATETRAIKAVLGGHAHKPEISGTKFMTGQLIGAAGALSAVTAAFAIHDAIVPPMINPENQDLACDLDYVQNVARRMPVQTAMVSAFGLGGQNVVTVP